MTQPGPEPNPLRVAIIGSGPAAFYAADHLFKQPGLAAEVDMFDRLPTPFGLVRGGVAPDHQKIKSVTKSYDQIAANPRFRFFGNVEFGKHVTVSDLRQYYHQILYATGAQTDRRMGIPGEDLAGSHPATEFVAWYNGHPDYRDQAFDLSQESAAVVGIGNVAMDVTRILAEDPDELKGTDIAAHALEALRHSRVKTVYLLGRRGPAQAAYSPAEFKEIAELSSADLVVDPTEAALDEASTSAYADPENKKNVDFAQAQAQKGAGARAKKVRLRFCVSPVEVIAENGRTVALKLEKNRLVADGKGGVKAAGTGQFETIPVGLVFRSVGYRGVPIPGVPFDEKAGRIPNEAGRVLLLPTGQAAPGEYVVGWAKRGPSGLIGTNRADSVATVKAMLEDSAAGKLTGNSVNPDPESLPALLRARGVAFVSFADWKAIDRAELERGKAAGKIREKFTDIPEMLAALEASRSRVSV